ncbi:MerR family transcriptional regulator [Bacillus sp. CECT 9360]|uniref:MerR family transcriptional regulator n=1 Tax=Bacillus sp. CECT 9360 TaxID=2845821 RepID=UPI001E31DC04|nr:MerR family transcriptional regulator [Bacillus sp. CECT 9360]CAH0343789.1 hypothetical protein BCI9360_00013 [Bacillus sp. CECT 9360]
MTNSQIQRAYSIKDVSKKINTPTGTIRQWEKDLQGLLQIPRSKQGARFYTEKEIILLEKIKEMRANNLSKDMIRKLMNKHLQNDSEAPSESVETPSPSSADNAIVTTGNVNAPAQTQSLEELYAAMETYKQNMVNEIKNVIQASRNEMIEELKNEISQANLQTVQGISRSIQRTNEKRKAEIEELNHAISQASELTYESFETISENIEKASELTSETFETLSRNIAKSSEDTFEKIARTSEGTFEKLSKQITASSTATKDNKNLLNKVSQNVKDTQKEIRTVTKSLHKDQELFVDSMNQNIKELTEVIQDREEAFNDMVSSFREAAATKKKKKWWKIWA